eukprot:758965-Hanusia_phi.AAC.2
MNFSPLLVAVEYHALDLEGELEVVFQQRVLPDVDVELSPRRVPPCQLVEVGEAVGEEGVAGGSQLAYPGVEARVDGDCRWGGEGDDSSPLRPDLEEVANRREKQAVRLVEDEDILVGRLLQRPL